MEELINKASDLNAGLLGNKIEGKELFQFIRRQGKEYNSAIEELGGFL
jgi:hypothetical protein